jgi:O-antigen/teichoic acid export membrane protein
MIKRNLAANLLGKIFMVLASIMFLPYYIRMIGIEAYGIVGFYTTLVAIFSILDLGLGTTMTREMARLSKITEADELRNLTRTLEWIYWSMAALIGLTVFLHAPFSANSWIKAQELSSETIVQAICCSGLALAFQWPGALYAGGLIGLQKQVLLNTTIATFVALRAIGLILTLRFISPTIQAFFSVQILISALQTASIAFFLWKELPKSSQAPRFDKAILRRIKRFAAGIASTSILAILFTQLDKVILSKMLSLEMFGYYTLAAVVASSLNYITSSIFAAFFPRFSQLVSLKDDAELKRVYHSGCQLISVMIIPIALMTALFSFDLIYIWTGNSLTAERTHALISFLICGTLLNGLMTLPYGLQLAYGWTKLGIYQNIVGIIMLTPLMILGVEYYGALGAACIGIILNAGFVFISIPLMHKKIIPQEKARWYFQDVALPLIASFVVVIIGKVLFVSLHASPIVKLLFLSAIFIISSLASVLVAPLMRSWLMTRFKRFNKHLTE